MVSLGFNLFMMKNKEKLDIVKNLPDSQKQVHHIFNPYEVIIPSQPEKSIHHYFKKEFFKNENIILGNSFYKVWEILSEFSLIKSKEPIVAISIGDGPGSVLQSIITYRNLHQKKVASKDLYCGIGIMNNNENIKCFTNAKLFTDNTFKSPDSSTISIFKKGFLTKTLEQFSKKKSVKFWW
jgi:hypothetical protein